MKIRVTFTFVLLIVLSTAAARGVAAAPVAPTILTPANGSTVQTPFTISWSPVSDPSGLLGYNWQVSSSSAFTTIAKQDSVNDPGTQAIVSGLAAGTYFWRVQAVSGAFEQGPWSLPRSFTITGVAAGTPGTPALGPTVGYSTFHPYESITFAWSAVPDAASYFLMYSNDQSFPVGSTGSGITTGWIDNIPTTTTGFIHALAEGTWYARVYAVSASGTMSPPSNVVSYTVFYRNPVPPAPVLIAPINNPSLVLPFALQWQHVLNPQPMGYDVQISSNASFTNNEAPLGTQLTNPEFKILTITPGQKFWRVRSNQGLASRNADGSTTNAVTAWSATGTFTIGAAPPTPVSITPVRATLFSGNDTLVEVQLTAGVPAAGATIALASSNQAVAPVPATVAMQGNAAWTQFPMIVGQVTAPTPVTISATINGVTASRQITVNPPSLKSLTLFASVVSGGATANAILSLNGQAPASGAVVNLESTNPAVTPPPTVTIPAGVTAVSVAMATNEVSASTPVTITATWSGASTQAQFTVAPGPAPSSLTLSPATVVGGGPGSVSGTVTITATAGFDQVLRVTSNNPTVLPTLSSGVIVPAGSTRGFLSILPSAVSATTVVRISVTGGGVTRFADLTVNPAATPPPPPPAGQPLTLTLTVTGRSGERVTSSPAGLSVAVAGSASATFTSGTAITLTVSNGRSAVWSGACSSGGTKVKSCRFTPTANASVTANVQ